MSIVRAGAGAYIMPSSMGARPIITPLKLALAPTPVHRLTRLSSLWGGDFWVKRDDLTGTELSGSKVRKLEYLVADALASNADTLITCGGVQSNHSRATAAVAARLGLRCRLLLRGTEPSAWEGNYLLDRLFGAETVFLSAADYYDNLDARLEDQADAVRKAGGRPYAITEGGSNALGAMGMVAGLRELKTQCDAEGIRPDRIVAAAGSGGTHAGLFVGTKLTNWPVEIVSAAVSYDRNETIHRIAGVVRDMQIRFDLGFDFDESEIVVNDRYLGPGYALSDPEEWVVIKEVARAEGIALDPVYTGKALWLIHEETTAGRMPGTTLYWHTGGVFGLFPFANELVGAFK